MNKPANEPVAAPPLEERKQAILRAVVLEYVGTAEPVSSEVIAQRYGLGVRSATVRNEMAEMASLGYLEQPHTSAGRVPSDSGYRFFVDWLCPFEKVGSEHAAGVQEATASGEALLGVLYDTAKVLSRLTHLLSVAMLYRDSGVTINGAVVSALGPRQAVLVLVLSNGHVESRMLEAPEGITLDAFGLINELLQNMLASKPVRTVGRMKAPRHGDPAIDGFLALIWPHFRSIARELMRGVVVSEGQEFVLAQPEFRRDMDSFAELVDWLTSEGFYEALIDGADGTQVVTIGKENRSEKLHRLSVVRSSFQVGETGSGFVALVGPTRMRYEVSMPLVSYTAEAISRSLGRPGRA